MVHMHRDGEALIITKGKETMRVEAWGPDAIRVRCSLNRRFHEQDWALLPNPGGSPAITVGTDQASLVSGGLAVVVNQWGQCRFRDAAGTVLIEEADSHKMRWYRALGGDSWNIEQRFTAHADESFWGLGQRRDAPADLKGSVHDLMHQNATASIPFVVSSRGYGFLWNNPCLGRVEFATNQTRWVCDRSTQIDYVVMGGGDARGVLGSYTAITGRPPQMPAWALGFWQSKLRYQTQDELLGVAREHVRRGHPLAVMVCDYFHWTAMGDWRFDPRHWPDPQAMIDELQALGVKLLVSVWPTLNQQSVNYAEFASRGWLTQNDRGHAVQCTLVDTRHEDPVLVPFYDATHPEARTALWDRVREGYVRFGIDSFWLDAMEPEVWPQHYEGIRLHEGHGEEVAQIWPLRHLQGHAEAMARFGVSEPVALVRCAWAGAQRYPAALWSGDIASTWASLREQLRVAGHVAMSGISWWNTDIGGFHGADINDPSWRELLVRWFQWGAFCPIMRLHGVRKPDSLKSGGPNEVWAFGGEVEGILGWWLRLRERLRPYLHGEFAKGAASGIPVMRPLLLDFWNDPMVRGIDDQFCIGDALLIAPVHVEGARSRRVYLPAGAAWTDAWSGVGHAGGTWVEAPAALDRLPVYIRDGRLKRCVITG